MYHGAVSTDIKKSSILWANLNKWMSGAVERTNNMTEYVFQSMEKIGIEQVQLPNSPEGDAYTFYFKGDDQEALKKHVKNVAHVLQRVYKRAREEGILSVSAEKVKEIIGNWYDERIGDEEEEIQKENLENEKKRKIDFILSKEFYHAIFVRIGVAFDNIPPVEYKYTVDLPDTKGLGLGRTWKIYKSYTGGVIKESERAEEKAKYKDAIAITQRGEKVKNDYTVGEKGSYKIGEDKDELVDLTIEMANMANAYKPPKKVNVNGYMIFIHYHLHITMEKVEEDPHLYSQMVDEFREIHTQTVETLENQIGYGQVYLVKVKRSTDSMFYIKPDKAPSTIWNTCLSLCAALPTGSSIGICFTRQPKGSTETGKLKRVTYKHNDGMDRVDYFGDCVNVSARMDTFDWEYDTGLFKVGKNDHKNRVAMACADTTTKGWGGKKGWGKTPPGSSFNRPYKIEDIPRDALNAGSANQFLRAISAHVYLGDTIREGDLVEWCDGDRKDCMDPYGKNFHVGRVLSVDFLRITIREMEYNEQLKKWVDTNMRPIIKNITYVKKRKAEPLESVADKLEKKDVLKGAFSQLKF